MKLQYIDFRVSGPVTAPLGSCYHVTATRVATVCVDNVARFTYPTNDADRQAQAKLMAEQFAYQMNLLKGQTVVPVLDLDKRLFKEDNGVPHLRARMERTIIANLIGHLEEQGFVLSSVHDGEDYDPVSDVKTAMETIFNVDESRIIFRNTIKQPRWVDIILGNGVDCIADWCEPKDDSDGWAVAMDSFDIEKLNLQ